MAYGGGGVYPYQVMGKPFIAEPRSVCTMTYLILNSFDSEDEAKNFIEYAKTKFFRFLVLMKKNTQHLKADRFSFVPDLNMNKKWTDKELYDKYGIDSEEINFINSLVKEME